jgi:hypothetical protein
MSSYNAFGCLNCSYSPYDTNTNFSSVESFTEKKEPINTRNEPCSKNGMTSCCPHNLPDKDGRYRATNEESTLLYRGKVYVLHTCCTMCSDAMNLMAAKNPDNFDKTYNPEFLKDGSMIINNRHTNEKVQTLKLK